MSALQQRLAQALGDRYRIERELVRGGMAVVYLATDQRHGRRVALKVLTPELARALGTDRFLREIEIAAQLSHPRIVPVLDSGAADDLLFYVMPYVEGESLRERLIREKQLSVEDAVEIARQVGAALAYAHGQGILHRDIKPENILLTVGEALVTDFGVARAISVAGETRLTETGIAVGTPSYMSPEQASGDQNLDERSDIYALGCVLYEMLAGDPPFTGPNAQAITARKLSEPPPDVAVIRDAVPPAVAEALRKALARVPADRPASASHFVDALRRLEAAKRRGRADVMVSRRNLLIGGAAAGIIGFTGGLVFPTRRRASVVPSYLRLTFQRGIVRTARFAPDYQTILYGALWDGDVCRVYQVRPERPESHPVDLPPATPLAISSQAEVALAVGTHFRGVITYGTLASVPLAGGVPRELVEDVKYADWSPDGTELALVRRVGNRDQVEFPAGTVLLQATSNTAPSGVGGISFPRVSPTGDRVAFFEHISGLRGRVATVDQRGGMRALTKAYVNVFGLSWRGDEIWFTAADERPLFRAVHAVDMRGNVRLIARVPGNASLHDIAPDGRMVIAHTNDRHQCAVSRAGETSERQLSWLDASQVADISDDGHVILFTEFGHGGGPEFSVYLRPTDGSPAVRLGDGRAVALSPDGRWAIALGAAMSSPYLDVLPTRAGEPERVQHPGLSYHEATWLPDGRRIVIHAQESDRPARLYVVALGDSQPRAITPEGTSAPWALSPDGRMVAAADVERRLHLFPIDGDADPRAVAGVRSGEQLLGWINDGLLFTDDRSGLDLGEIFLVNAANGQRRPWKTIAPRDPAGIMFVSNLRVTPDGRSYAYSWHRALSDLYLVEGLAG